MRSRVRLKEVTARNWEAVAELSLDPDQENLVASNLFSIAESKFDANSRPRAVVAGKRIVGFLMYEVHRTRGKARASIYRFMIDRTQQGKGYGRAALAEALKEIQTIPTVEKVRIRYMPENTAAKSFYGSFGFKEIGRDEDGEIVAELRL